MNKTIEEIAMLFTLNQYAIQKYLWYQPSKFSIFQRSKSQKDSNYWARSARSYLESVRK